MPLLYARSAGLSFLDLPMEVRFMIFELLFPALTIHCRGTQHWTYNELDGGLYPWLEPRPFKIMQDLSMLWVCKQLFPDVLHALFSAPVRLIRDVHGVFSPEDFPIIWNIHTRIRRLVLPHGPFGVTRDIMHKSAPGLWPMELPRLSQILYQLDYRYEMSYPFDLSRLVFKMLQRQVNCQLYASVNAVKDAAPLSFIDDIESVLETQANLANANFTLFAQNEFELSYWPHRTDINPGTATVSAFKKQFEVVSKLSFSLTQYVDVFAVGGWG
jgi:hypothetical protein